MLFSFSNNFTCLFQLPPVLVRFALPVGLRITHVKASDTNSLFFLHAKFLVSLCGFLGAAIIKYHKPGGLKPQKIFFHSPGG